MDEEGCNPLKVWHDMGEPASLSQVQLAFLQESGKPVNASAVVESVAGQVPVALLLQENAVVHFTLTPSALQPDYGYDYTWYCHNHS